MKENQHRVFARADNRADKLTWNAGPAPQLATWLANCADLLHLLDHPASSTYPMATPTVQFDKYKCPCFKCCSVKDKSRRTIRIHFKENLAHLSKLRSSGGDLDTLEFVENSVTMSLHGCLAAWLRTLKQLGHLYLLIQMVSPWFLMFLITY